jgi:tetratricopeptide (TPR) repeat protein
MDPTPQPQPPESEHNRLYRQATALLEGQMPFHGLSLPRPGFFLRRRIRRAIRMLERVTTINPRNWAALWVTGMAYRRLDDPAAALDRFTRAHENNPDQPDVAREAGLAAMDARRPDLAIAFTSRAIRADPNDPGLVANLALAHLFNQSPQAALDIATRALNADPSDKITRAIVDLAQEVIAGRRKCPTHVSDVGG